jgi:hypothetical protein
MNASSFFCPWWERQDGGRKGAVAGQRRSRLDRRPCVEDLEGRLLLTSITEFGGLTAASGPLDIVVGPDNNLWFTEYNGAQIGRPNFATSPSNTVNLPVLNPTTTTITVASPTVAPTVLVEVTVTPPAGVTGTPSGQVDLSIDGVFKTSAKLDTSGVATFRVSPVTAGMHQFTASYEGDSGFAASQDLNVPVNVIPFPTRVALTASPSPATAGQSVTLTATVSLGPPPPISANGIHAAQTPGFPPFGGSVTFKDGSTALITVSVSADGVATFSTTTLGLGQHALSAVYNGDMTFGTSTSATVPLTVNPSTDGPTVVSVQRFGFHAMPTTLVLTFNEALDPASAQDVKNYQILAPGGHPIAVNQAVYDASSQSVTLSPAHRLNLHRRYRLTVIGTGPGGVKVVSGNLLDGAGNGRPGSNFITTVDAGNLVVTASQRLPGASAALRLANRFKLASSHRR